MSSTAAGTSADPIANPNNAGGGQTAAPENEPVQSTMSSTAAGTSADPIANPNNAGGGQTAAPENEPGVTDVSGNDGGLYATPTGSQPSTQSGDPIEFIFQSTMSSTAAGTSADPIANPNNAGGDQAAAPENEPDSMGDDSNNDVIHSSAASGSVFGNGYAIQSSAESGSVFGSGYQSERTGPDNVSGVTNVDGNDDGLNATPAGSQPSAQSGDPIEFIYDADQDRVEHLGNKVKCHVQGCGFLGRNVNALNLHLNMKKDANHLTNSKRACYRCHLVFADHQSLMDHRRHEGQCKSNTGDAGAGYSDRRRQNVNGIVNDIPFVGMSRSTRSAKPVLVQRKV